MAHGGARSRSGPPPDPTALRRDRKDDAATWITLPSARTGPVPKWPLTVPPTPAEATHWKRLWKTPESTLWEADAAFVDVAIYVRTLVRVENPDAPVGLVKDVRIMAENLGLSFGSRLRNRWRVADSSTEIPNAATATTKTPTARSSRGPSSRDRFRVVPPVEEE